jgi:flagellar biosynthesis/type III secretory pathway protein FliH
MSAAETFVSLADLLRPAAREELPSVAEGRRAEAEAIVTQAPGPVSVGASADVRTPEMRAAIRDARLFRARLGEALDARLARLLAAIASEVLVRELRIAPFDLKALVARIAGEVAAQPVCIRIAPGDRTALGSSDTAALGDIPLREDETLAPGDLIVVFADGEIDARLGVRLAAVLEMLR